MANRSARMVAEKGRRPVTQSRTRAYLNSRSGGGGGPRTRQNHKFNASYGAKLGSAKDSTWEGHAVRKYGKSKPGSAWSQDSAKMYMAGKTSDRAHDSHARTMTTKMVGKRAGGVVAAAGLAYGGVKLYQHHKAHGTQAQHAPEFHQSRAYHSR